MDKILATFQKYRKYIMENKIGEQWDENGSVVLELCPATLSQRLSLEFILDHIRDFPWDMYTLCQRSDWTIAKIRIYKDTLDLNWNSLSRNEVFEMEKIMENSDLPWIPADVSENPNIDPEHYPDYSFKESDQLYCGYQTSRKQEIKNIADMTDAEVSAYTLYATYEDIKNNLHRKWDWERLICNPNYDEKWDYFLLHIECPLNTSNRRFNADVLSIHRTLPYVASLKTILDNPQVQWGTLLSSNKNITWEFFFSHPDWKWDLNRFSWSRPIKAEDLDMFSPAQLSELDWKSVCDKLIVDS